MDRLLAARSSEVIRRRARAIAGCGRVADLHARRCDNTPIECHADAPEHRWHATQPVDTAAATPLSGYRYTGMCDCWKAPALGSSGEPPRFTSRRGSLTNTDAFRHNRAVGIELRTFLLATLFALGRSAMASIALWEPNRTEPSSPMPSNLATGHESARRRESDPRSLTVRPGHSPTQPHAERWHG